jgi:hypothetical protein
MGCYQRKTFQVNTPPPPLVDLITVSKIQKNLFHYLFFYFIVQILTTIHKVWLFDVTCWWHNWMFWQLLFLQKHFPTYNYMIHKWFCNMTNILTSPDSIVKEWYKYLQKICNLHRQSKYQFECQLWKLNMKIEDQLYLQSKQDYILLGIYKLLQCAHCLSNGCMITYGGILHDDGENYNQNHPICYLLMNCASIEACNLFLVFLLEFLFSLVWWNWKGIMWISNYVFQKFLALGLIIR